MEYQNIIDLLGDSTNQPSKFRTRNWVEVSDESRGTYDYNSDIKFKTSMIRSSSCDESDKYMNVKTTITVPNAVAKGATVNNTNKKSNI